MSRRPRLRLSFRAKSFLWALAGVAALAAVGSLALQIHWIVATLLAVNAMTLVLYGYDKSAAGTSRMRIPETTLHGLAFLGGSPAALLAQRLFRHKTAKRGFQAVFWLNCGVQLAALAWYVWKNVR